MLFANVDPLHAIAVLGLVTAVLFIAYGLVKGGAQNLAGTSTTPQRPQPKDEPQQPDSHVDDLAIILKTGNRQAIGFGCVQYLRDVLETYCGCSPDEAENMLDPVVKWLPKIPRKK